MTPRGIYKDNKTPNSGQSLRVYAFFGNFLQLWCEFLPVCHFFMMHEVQLQSIPLNLPWSLFIPELIVTSEKIEKSA